MAEEFELSLSASLDTDKVEAQITELKNRIKNEKIELDVEIGNNSSKNLQNVINKALKSTKVDTSTLSKQLAESFNIKDSSVKKKITSQLNSLMAEVASSWNGLDLDISKSTGKWEAFDQLAEAVTQNASIIKSQMGIYQEFFDYFKNQKVYISDALKSELGSDTYKDLLKNNIGKITTDITKGMNIDSLYSEMSSMFPELFSSEITAQADQIVKVFDTLKAARADFTQTVSASNMTAEELTGIKDDAYDQIISGFTSMTDRLEQNLRTATTELGTAIDLDITINDEKIASDIRNAIQSALTVDDMMDISLNLDTDDLTTKIRSVLSTLGSGGEPIELDIQVNKETLQSDLNMALDDLDLPIHFKIDAAELESDIRAAIESITDIDIDLRINTGEIKSDIDNVIDDDVFDTTAANKLNNSLNTINTTARQGQSVFQSFGNTLQEAFGYYTLANVLQDSIYKVIEVGKEALTTVQDLNDAAVSLQMATGESSSYVSNLMDSYNELGQELGATTTDVSEAADSWLRQGHNIEDTNTLIYDSMVLSKVSDLDSADATEYLTSAMQGYSVAAEDVMSIVDKLSSVDLVSATDAGGLAEAMSKIATTADSAGISMDTLLGYLATVGEVTQG